MSVHRLIRKSGERFVVRYRDPNGVNRSRVFATQEEAERYEQRVAAARRERRERQLQADLERF